ncbi:MAG: 8-oxo-dGTP diphosphatase [Patescibacteria group bacterium]
MKKLRDVTLLFLIKKRKGKTISICLAMKKRGFGSNRWNGVGGKVKEGEFIEAAAIREAKEEIGVEVNGLKKVAELSFFFPHNPLWNQKVHVYFCKSWIGEPIETEEMKPEWFFISNIPFKDMWPADIFWIPEVIAEKKVIGSFVFGEGDVVLEKEVSLVSSFAESI